jgi:hypothetical protein
LTWGQVHNILIRKFQVLFPGIKSLSRLGTTWKNIHLKFKLITTSIFNLQLIFIGVTENVFLLILHLFTIQLCLLLVRLLNTYRMNVLQFNWVIRSIKHASHASRTGFAHIYKKKINVLKKSATKMIPRMMLYRIMKYT